MPKFRDIKDYEWELRITIGDLMAIREATGHDLLDLKADESGGGQFLSFLGDPYQFGAALWCLVADQASGVAGVTAENFPRRLDGRATKDAQVALAEAVIDFFTGYVPDVGRMLAVVWAKYQATLDRGAAVVLRKAQSQAVDELIAGSIRTLEQELDDQIQSLSSPGGSPEPPA